MTPQIEKTSLWANSFGGEENDPNKQQLRERLKNALLSFRQRASELTSRISAEFPQLTVHDITHLDALWDTGSIIAGQEYPLNPMEAFVFGGAILLHDSAHCFEAFAGGQTAVRATKIWEDAFAAEKESSPNASEAEIGAICDFLTVRALHASQAEKLVEFEWKNTSIGSSIYLIDDAELRSRFGALIGKIAASHHWDIDEVQAKLRDQVNVPGGWPNEWRVDPIKLACLLRCADAAHIDNRRAPDFLFALLRRTGVSRDHWIAQNWLSKADIDLSERSKRLLLITSTRSFPSADANAWWVAFDAISVLDSEIKSANNLLKSRGQQNSGSPPFYIEGVRGASDPVELARYVEADGWVPTKAAIHVSNIEKLIRNLGGESLYGSGDNFSVILRELLQSARDAVVARRSLDPDHIGKITVVVSRKSENQTHIDVRDNGTGMSERTMTTTLLDFGTSFWASNLVRSEFPGLKSSGFRPVGKYGIGFYSVFMIASEVFVSSRRYDAGMKEVTNLYFGKGTTLRPILSKGPSHFIDVNASTVVRLTVDQPIEGIISRSINPQNPKSDVKVPLLEYISCIVAGLDVDVFLKIEDSPLVLAHLNVNEMKSDKEIREWLHRISFYDIEQPRDMALFRGYVDRNFGRMRPLWDNGNLLGVAALLAEPTDLPFLTTDTVGGLTNIISRGTGAYIGYMENVPNSAKRDFVKKASSPVALRNWADEQIALIKADNADKFRLYWAASSLANLELDPIDVISFPIFRQGIGLQMCGEDEILNILKFSPIACLKSRQFDFADTHADLVNVYGLPLLRPLINGSLLSLDIVDGVPVKTNTLISCLYRIVSKRGLKLVFETIPTEVKSFLGPLDALKISLAKS